MIFASGEPVQPQEIAEAFAGIELQQVENALRALEEHYAALAPKLTNITAYPSRHRDSRGPDGTLSYAAGTARLELIQDMTVICVEDGREARLRDLGPLAAPYSRS